MSVAALSGTGGAVRGVDPGTDTQTTAQQRMAFLLEEHGYSTGPIADAAPTETQRMQFLLEEHGHDAGTFPPSGDALADAAPTPQQRTAFLLEEHGYSTEPIALGVK
jgi:hypothetical protein